MEEREPIDVDRDAVWVLSDWRLTKDAAIAGGFGNFMDVSHAGRIGNVVTINGTELDQFVVRAGERIRLRLVNAANARVFALEFGGHAPPSRASSVSISPSVRSCPRTRPRT